MAMMSSLLVKRSTAVVSHRLAIPISQTVCWFSDEPAKKQVKVKKKKKGKQDTVKGHDRDLDLILRSLDAPFSQEPEIDNEEKERRYKIGKAYVVGMFERHNERNHDLSCKMKLKSFAIKMLPRNSILKEEALKIDPSGPPPWRHIMADTPPIPNFDPSKFVHRDDD